MMIKQKKIGTAAVIGALAVATAAISGVTYAAQNAAPAATAVALPKSPLAAKKTIQTEATFSVMNSKSGEFMPFFAVRVTVDGPQRYRIDATPLKAEGKAKSFYFSDGGKQYEYNSLIGEYKIADAPKAGERPMSQLSAMAGLNLLLHPGAPPRTGSTRTVTEETLDGRKAVVVTDAEAARKSPDGKTWQAFTRVWLDTQTGLPIRQIEGSLQDGVAMPNLRLDFTKWDFDQPIAPATFAWAIPPGAKSASEPKILPVGAVAPDFAVVTPEGNPMHLSDLKGKVVIVDFWATWCGPCQRSMPHLESVYQRLKGRDDVAVLGVCVWDERAAFDTWVKANAGTKYNFPLAFDPAGRGATSVASAGFQVTGIPTQFVIGKDGKVAAAFVGFLGEDDHRLEVALDKLGVPASAPVQTAAK